MTGPRKPRRRDAGDGRRGVAAETTGAYLVVVEDEAASRAPALLRQTAGLTVASTADAAEGALEAGEVGGADGVFFDELGVAVVEAQPDQVQALSAAVGGAPPLQALEPERVVHAIADTAPPREVAAAGPPADLSEYLRGYGDAVAHLTRSLGAAMAPATAAVAAAEHEDELTWGLQAVGAPDSPCAGRGVKVAVLDTGFDLEHPDFAGRPVKARSFVDGETAQDGHGHGTHVIGTACGPSKPEVLPRYGIAYESEIYAGKVLGDTGRGSDRTVLAGINWAVRKGCPIVSMSLGSRVQPGDRYSRVFERAARRALLRGTVIIAAAGNDSRREVGEVSPVAHPANCPTIMAVGALDEQLGVAPFSNRGIDPRGGQVDIAAPGVRVYSSWPMLLRYHTISGTSMATPHVSGVAALVLEDDPGAAGVGLLARLLLGARRLPLPAVDVGVGLVQAP